MTMYKSESLAGLATALSQAQGELSDAAKSSKNPHFNSRYADLAEILQTIRPVLSKHGLSVVQSLGAYTKDSGTVQVSTTLLHKSGEFITDSLYVPVSKPDAQGIGAAVTYARRYSLAAMVGIAQDDDDGETAVGRGAAGVSTDAAPKKGKASKTKETPPPTMTAGELIKAIEGATKESLPTLAPAFASLPAEDQATVLPHLKAARERLGL